MSNTRTTLLLSSLFASFLLAGCEQNNQYQASPPPAVTISKPLVMDVEDYVEFTGTTEPFKRVEIRARVKGFLESVHFKEGDFVEEGELLFKIDPRSFQAQVDQAKAEVIRTEVQLDKAEDTFRRMESLFKKKATNEQDYIQAKAQRDKSASEVLGAKAILADAALNLGYTEVKSPIKGKIGKYEVNVGNLVGDGQSTLLTTVVNFTPVFAYFNVSEQQILAYIRRDMKENGEVSKADLSLSDKDKIPVSLALSDEPNFSHEGYIDYADFQLDAASGTFLIRGIFPNKRGDIIPGLFIRLRLADKQYENAILINENAFSADMIGRYLYIVNQEKKVEKRYFQEETLGALVHGFRVVKEGLSPDDLVIVNGIQRARDGIEVNPKEVETVPPKALLNSAPEKKKAPEEPKKTAKKPVKKSSSSPKKRAPEKEKPSQTKKSNPSKK